MDIGFPILDTLTSLIIALAAVPALWIAGRIVLRDVTIQDRSVRLFVWLVLGGLFLIPLVELISYARNLLSVAVQVAVSPMAGSPVVDAEGFPLLFGSTTFPVYFAMSTTLALISYWFAIRYGRRWLANAELPILKELALTPLEQTFVILGLAGLFVNMINGVVINTLWIRIPSSTTVPGYGWIGMAASWLVALLVLAAAIGFMRMKLGGE